MNDKEVITNFLRKMASQSNRGTAFPFFYVIRDYRKEFVTDETETPYFFDGERYLSFDEYNKYQSECDEPKVSLDEFENLDNIVRGYFQKTPFIVEDTLFLTETDAENHLKENYYHYSAKAHTYVMHAWRAPELKEFLNSLFSYFEIEHK